MKRTLYILPLAALIVFLWAGEACAQIGREGEPLSWETAEPGAETEHWIDLPALDINALVAEDNATSGLKSLPYRFASAQEVSVDLGDGGWRNFLNGDRIWLMGIRCPNATALSITFSNLVIPAGAALYIYNEDRSDFIGPLTAANSRVDRLLGTVPIGGNGIIIEYFEPYAQRGKGELLLSSVACAYRDLTEIPAYPGSDCLEVADPDFPEKNFRGASASVLLMLVDNGQRVATGTFINNTNFDGTPYVVTAIQALIGDPDSWVFVHRVVGANTDGQVAWDNALSGAVVLHEQGSSGLALLRLRERPPREWEAFFAGWSHAIGQGSAFYSLQHAFAGPQTIASTLQTPVTSSWNAFNTVRVAQWSDGNVFPGAIGAPLFDENGMLVGVFVGGDHTCLQAGEDHFGKISTAWQVFRYFLDPFSNGLLQIPGLFPSFEGNGDGTADGSLVLFPNPVSDQAFIQNNSNEPITGWTIMDTGGRIVRSESQVVPSVDVRDLSPGIYQVVIWQPSGPTVIRCVVR